jgi:NADH dehydrogenase [ubiquinone] 1 alpha subcomplex assembly factor 1
MNKTIVKLSNRQAALITTVMWLSAPMMAIGEDSMQINFTDLTPMTDWKINNDVVMGGRSNSHIQLSSDQKALRFSGNVSLENNGGFAATEYQLKHAVIAGDQLTLVVEGDGKDYQLRLKTQHLANGQAYVVTFTTTANHTSEHHFSPNDFQASFRGRSVPNAPTLVYDDIDRIGILVAMQPGPFVIKLQSLQINTLSKAK